MNITADFYQKYLDYFINQLLYQTFSLKFQVPGNSDGAVSINKPRRYRQYMNRKGGFNRPLDYVA